MAKISRQVDLQASNTFGLAARAAELAVIRTVAELREVLRAHPGPYFVLGGGSNLLWVKSPEGLVLKNEIKGIELLEEGEGHALIAAGGGEVWQDLVEWALERDLGGIENLSLIPGTVGAAPIQNIGAYGVELKDVFERLEAVDLRTGQTHLFEQADCRFGYRNSVFKQELKGAYFISRVVLRLHKAPHRLRLEYGALREVLESKGIKEAGIRDLAAAVVQIRRSKLPDPAAIGNAGSFFKNPELEVADFQRLQQDHPEVPHYPLPSRRVKVPAGWLIEQCGWKGKRSGRVGCYEKQALVIVNYGGAEGQEIWAFAQKVIRSVEEKFGIRLEPEVNVLR